MSAGAVKKVGRDLTTGSVLTALLIFAVPIILTNLIQQLYSMVDLMVAGQFVGTTGTVGVSTGGEMSDFLTPVATAFATAGQIYVAQLAGAGRHQDLKTAIGTLLTLMMGMSLVFLVVVAVFKTQFLGLLNCPPEAFKEAEDYMLITAAGLPFIFGYNAVSGVLRGMGESKWPLIFIIVAATANIFLDLMLVIWFGLGVVGTAIATMASQLASFLAAFYYMYSRKEEFDFELNLRYFRVDSEHARVIMGLGIPQACRSMLVRVSMLWVNSSVNAYGLIVSGTNSVGNKLQKFLEIFAQSLSQAGAAMIGQNLGARKYDRAKKVVYNSLVCGVAFSALTSVIVFFFPKEVFGIFTKDPDVLDLGVIYLKIMIVHFMVSAVISAFQSMVIGAGNAPLNFVIGVLDGVICKIGLSILFAYVMGMEAIGFFWGTALSRVLPAVICIIYFYRGSWKKGNLLEKTAKPERAAS